MHYNIDINKAIRKEGERRRLSQRTIETYCSCISRFLSWSKKTVDVVSKKDVREFLEKLSEKGAAGNTLNVYHMAIRFLMEDILNKKMRLNVKYSRVPAKLPLVLTKEETKRVIGKIHNWKHRLMIELLYGAGLRVSELLDLKVEDLEIERSYGYVRKGKGAKDRLFVLPKIVAEKIKNLVEIEKLEKEDFVFRSNREKRYSARSMQEVVKRAVKEAKIGKKAHLHTLRHSFATHLIENGYSVNDVQALLGHKSPETTMVYVHLASPSLIKIKSPLDSL